MSEPIQKWIFIAGAARSGTSLLQAIFNQHPLCFSPPESHLLMNYAFAPIGPVLDALQQPGKIHALLEQDEKVMRLGLRSQDVLPKNFSDTGVGSVAVFSAYMNALSVREKKPFLVEGAPQNVFFIPYLESHFPGCYILHIVRDPRDVTLSNMKAGFTQQFQVSALSLASRFMEGYRRAEAYRQIYGNRFIRLYYEDLIREPEGVLRNLCAQLGIDFYASMLNFQDSSSKVASVTETWKENLNKGFLRSNFNKWMNEMKKEDILQTEFICSEFFKKEKDHYTLSPYYQSISFLLRNRYQFLERKRRIKRLLFSLSNTYTARRSEIDELPTIDRLRAMDRKTGRLK